MKKLLLFLLFCTFLHAEVIKDYHVSIRILQSGSLQVDERITYDFGQTQRHGIYRDIPYTVQTDFLPKDIGLHDFTVSMDGKEIPWEKTTTSSDAGEMVRIKIGDPDRTITGRHIYQISYRVKKGVLLQDSQHDSVRWNAVGTGWRVPIQKAIVDIFLPKSLSRNNTQIHTFTGNYGSTSTKATFRWVDPHYLQVEVHDLAPHEGLTVEVVYPKGLLAQRGEENSTTSAKDYLKGLLPWGGMGLFLFYLYRFYEQHTYHLQSSSVVPMYEPPKGFDVLQSGLLLDRVADTTDFAAAVIELAQKGYIDIFKNDKLTVLKKRDKDTKALSEDEKYLLEHILFPEDDMFVLNPHDTNSAESLRAGFEKINSMLYTWSVDQGYMAENPKKARKDFLLKSALYGLPLLALAIVTSVMTIGTTTTILMMGLSVFVIAGIWIALSSPGIMSKIFGAVFAGLPLFTALPTLMKSDWKIILFTPLPLLVIALISVLLTYKKIGKYTPKGARAYLHLKGLEEFIKRVKEDEIRRRLDEDPLFLDKLLPYAILFGVTKHWLNFYKAFAVTPLWYDGDIDQLDGIHRDLHSLSTLSASDTGGPSGGGSFSGGGGGGGGGGSW